MKRLPYWQPVSDAMQRGMWQFCLANPMSIATDSVIQAQTKSIAKFMLGINALADFSTRDYAYDRGGDTLTDTEVVGDRWICIWVREDGQS